MGGKNKRRGTNQGPGDTQAVRAIGGEAAARWAACGGRMAVSAATKGALYHAENDGGGLFVLYPDGSVLMSAQGHGVCVPPGGIAAAATQLVAIALLGGPRLGTEFSHDEMVELGRLKLNQEKRRETLS